MNTGLQDLVIFDLDGTLALVDHRRHHISGKKKDFATFESKCVDDGLNEPVATVFKSLQQTGLEIRIFSGRSENVRRQTEAWLLSMGLQPDVLKMRPDGDFIADEELKERWLKELSDQERSRILCVFDDRQKVVAMWRRNKVVCFQVAQGDF